MVRVRCDGRRDFCRRRRTPNVEGIGLEAAGVEYDKNGVKVNARLQTTNPGSCCGRLLLAYKFTHAADAMAQIVIQNALFPHPLGLAMPASKKFLCI